MSPDKLRWKVARLANRIPGMCWSSLVSWALRHDGYTLRGSRIDWACRRDLASNGRCYCGTLEDVR